MRAGRVDRVRVLLVAALAFAVMSTVVSGAHAAKYYDSSVGATSGSPALGLTFASAPRDVAVNDPGINDGNAAANGDYYVVDDANHRIQRINADGTFDIAWGVDVVTGAGTNFEVCNAAAVCKVGVVSGGNAGDNLRNGALDNPQGIAVDQDTGNVYVSDRDNRRINEYGADGSFIRSFGFDSAANVNEVQSVTVNAAAGQFRLTFNGQQTGDLDFNATAASVQAALNGLSTVAPGAVTVSGGPGAAGGGTPYSITFTTGAGIAGANVAQLVSAQGATPLSGGSGGGADSATVATTVQGGGASTGYEVCESADRCKVAVAGTGIGQFSAGTTANGYRLDFSKPDSNPATGKLFFANTGNRRVEVYGLDGGAPSSFGTDAEFVSGAPLGVAVDAAGVVYANDGGNRLRRYASATAQFLDVVDLQVLTGASSTTGRSGLEINRITGNLFVTAATSGTGLVEIGNPGAGPVHLATYPTVFTASFTPNGLGLNPDTGKIYMTTSTTAQRVVVFDDDGLSPIDVDIQPATNVQATTADLHATINPAPNGPTGQPTSYRFEVSKNGVTWTAVTSNTQVPPNGDTNADTVVNAGATGLEPNTLYRVRVAATRASNSGAATSAELVFATDPSAPVVITDAASQVADRSAQLLGRLNPGGLDTSYWFEWGDDTYGNVIPIPAANAGAGTVPRVVGEVLSTLDAGTTYHFRLCARNSLAANAVCGVDRTFTTHAPIADPPSRSYEMVTSPEKVLRRGGGQDLTRFGTDYARLGTDAIPATDGDSILWTIFGGVSDPNAGTGFSHDRGMEFRRRQDRDGDGNADGWYGEAVVKVPAAVAASGADSNMYGVSADLETQVWGHAASLFPRGNFASTFVAGSTGGPLGAGWFPTADPDWSTNPGVASATSALPLVDDKGERWLGTSTSSTGEAQEYRNLIPADGGLSPDALTPPQESGGGLFMFGPPDWRPLDLVNECTGTLPGDSTRLPARGDAGTDAVAAQGVGNLASNSATVTGVTTTNGAFAVGQRVEGVGIVQGTTITAVGAGTLTLSVTYQFSSISGASLTAFSPALLEDDTIGDRLCAQGSPTDVRGATIGSETKDSSQSRLSGLASTALSVDGDRAFFLSPDPTDVTPITPPPGGRSCMDAAGAGTRCPAQLFVRQYDDEGNATVRWLSRAEDALFDAPQRIAALGSGVSFEGASSDGSVVYFRTDAPLTADDPNGGISAVTGPAAANSWDLYRYDLGDDNDADPAPPTGDAGDRLTRISGGPSGTADPNTNCPHVATSGPETGSCATNVSPSGVAQTPNGGGGVVRFMSDDGERVYFVTAAQIPGADNGPPAGGSTAPTATGARANSNTRNLYLFDGSKTGSAAYKFIAEIPFSMDKFNLDACASFASSQSGTPRRLSFRAEKEANCVHGTSSGDAVAFETTGQLTADDTDTAGDVYVYEAGSDKLVRVSAPLAGAETPYVCLHNAGTGVVTAYCNGDLGASPQYPYDKVGLEGRRGMNIAEDDQGGLLAIYFESRHPLAPGAAANAAMKVYEWRDGEISLISPAGATDSAFYSSNGRDGQDVFFWTEQRISAWEIENGDGDVYSATTRPDRLPDPPPVPAICAVLAASCQGGGTPEVEAAPRTRQDGDGDGGGGARAKLTVGSPTAKARRRTAKTGVLPLGVRSTSAGRLTATASARVPVKGGKKRTRRVGVARVTAKAGRKVTLKLRLSDTARRELRAGRSLRLSIQVAQSGVRSRTVTVLLPGAGS